VDTASYIISRNMFIRAMFPLCSVPEDVDDRPVIKFVSYLRTYINMRVHTGGALDLFLNIFGELAKYSPTATTIPAFNRSRGTNSESRLASYNSSDVIQHETNFVYI